VVGDGAHGVLRNGVRGGEYSAIGGPHGRL
jgi:hypothetical protein